MLDPVISLITKGYLSFLVFKILLNDIKLKSFFFIKLYKGVLILFLTKIFLKFLYSLHS